MKILEVNINSLDEIKNEIVSNVGKTIVIQEFNKQGKQIHEYTGEIMDTYASLFLVKVSTNNFFINRSFSYADFITRDRSYEILEKTLNLD